MKDSGATLVMDLGGTGSRALLQIGNESRRSEAPSGNPNRVGPKAAEACIFDLLRGVAADGATLARAAIGMAGASHPESRALAGRAFAAARVTVTHGWFMNDAELAHGAAFPDPARQGVLLVGGTGSIAVAKAPDGGFVRAGGRGPVAGDEGSGHWIGLRLREAAASDSRLAAALHAVFDEAATAGAPSILASALDRLAPVHASAAAIAEAAGDALAVLAIEAFEASGVAGPRVRCTGSVAVRSIAVRAAFRRSLAERAPHLVDDGDVADVLVSGMEWLKAAPSEGVPPGW